MKGKALLNSLYNNRSVHELTKDLFYGKVGMFKSFSKEFMFFEFSIDSETVRRHIRVDRG